MVRNILEDEARPFRQAVRQEFENVMGDAARVRERSEETRVTRPHSLSTEHAPRPRAAHQSPMPARGTSHRGRRPRSGDQVSHPADVAHTGDRLREAPSTHGPEQGGGVRVDDAGDGRPRVRARITRARSEGSSGASTHLGPRGEVDGVEERVLQEMDVVEGRLKQAKKYIRAEGRSAADVARAQREITRCEAEMKRLDEIIRANRAGNLPDMLVHRRELLAERSSPRAIGEACSPQHQRGRSRPASPPRSQPQLPAFMARCSLVAQLRERLRVATTRRQGHGTAAVIPSSPVMGVVPGWRSWLRARWCGWHVADIPSARGVEQKAPAEHDRRRRHAAKAQEARAAARREARLNIDPGLDEGPRRPRWWRRLCVRKGWGRQPSQPRPDRVPTTETAERGPSQAQPVAEMNEPADGTLGDPAALNMDEDDEHVGVGVRALPPPPPQDPTQLLARLAASVSTLQQSVQQLTQREAERQQQTPQHTPHLNAPLLPQPGPPPTPFTPVPFPGFNPFGGVGPTQPQLGHSTAPSPYALCPPAPGQPSVRSYAAAPQGTGHAKESSWEKEARRNMLIVRYDPSLDRDVKKNNVTYTPSLDDFLEFVAQNVTGLDSDAAVEALVTLCEGDLQGRLRRRLLVWGPHEGASKWETAINMLTAQAPSTGRTASNLRADLHALSMENMTFPQFLNAFHTLRSKLDYKTGQATFSTGAAVRDHCLPRLTPALAAQWTLSNAPFAVQEDCVFLPGG